MKARLKNNFNHIGAGEIIARFMGLNALEFLHKYFTGKIDNQGPEVIDLMMATNGHKIFFTKSDQPLLKQTQKLKRNKIYRICGVTITLCAVLLTIHFRLSAGTFPRSTTFILEVIALWAFGLSWLIKGDTFLKDARTRALISG